jgi:hypothetical protein
VEAVFILAERNGKGVFEARHAWFHSGAQASIERQSFVDVIDVKGPASPMLLQTSATTSRMTTPCSETAGKWVEIYKSQTMGC